MVFPKVDINSKNFKIAIVVVIVLVFIGLYLWKRKRENIKSSKSSKTKKSSKSTKTKKKILKSPKKKVTFEDDYDDEDDESSEDLDEVDQNVRGDAEELFNLTHEGLAKGMQKSEFKALVGDLADDYTFIQLKQLYNDREKRNMDPLKSIDVTDYIKILQTENM